MNNETTHGFRRIIRTYWSAALLIIIVLITLTYSVLLLGFEGSSPKGQSLGQFYWFYVDATPVSLAHIVCELILGAALLSSVLWIILNIRRYIKRLYGWGLLFIAVISFCILAFFAVILATSTNIKHLDELRQDSHLYRLASWPVSSDDYSDILFECDSIGIICSEICSSKVDYSKILTQQPEILFSGSPQVISIVDNEQTLCSAEAKS